MPFYSIIISSFNDGKNLINLSKNLNSQNFDDYEVLISDGGSTDDTVKYINSGAIRNLSWCKSSKDKGIYDALNTALKHAVGQWVLVIGCDDELSDDESLMRANKAISILSSDVGIAYSDLLIRKKSKIIQKKYPEYIEFKKKYRGGAFIHHQTAFIRRGCILKIGEFDDLYKVHADYDLMLKISNIAEVEKIEGAYVIFNADGFSSKLGNLWLSFCEVRNIRKSHGLVSFPIRLLITYSALLIRRLIPFRKL